MVVYVDRCKIRKWRCIWSHMAADSLDELHKFAKSISLSERYFHTKPYPHYDVTRKKKRIALLNGAQEISNREFIGKAKALREPVDI